MGVRKIFVAQKRPPISWSKKYQNGPHLVKKTSHNEKSVAKGPQYEEKVAKMPPILQKNCFYYFPGGGRRPTLAPPPAGDHVQVVMSNCRL